MMNKKTEAVERLAPKPHFRVTRKGVPIPDHVKFIRKPLGEREFDAMVCKSCCYGCCILTPCWYCILHEQADTLIRGLRHGSVPIVGDEQTELLRLLQGVWKIREWSADPTKFNSDDNKLKNKNKIAVAASNMHGFFNRSDRCPFTTALVQGHYLVLSGGHKMLKTNQYFDLQGQGQANELIVVEENDPVESTLCFYKAPDGTVSGLLSDHTMIGVNNINIGDNVYSVYM